MAVKRDIFGSETKKQAHVKLQRPWTPLGYEIYFNLPFSAIFDVFSNAGFSSPVIPVHDLIRDKAEFTAWEINYLQKASVDFTVCGPDGRPLLCVDLDDQQNGFNVMTNYYPGPTVLGQENGTDRLDEVRKQYQAKLKFALGSNFPYFIACANYFTDIAPDVPMMVVDTFIGDILMNRYREDCTSAVFDPVKAGYSQEEFDQLTDGDQESIAQNWALSANAADELTFFLASGHSKALYRELREVGPGRIEIAFYPPLPDNDIERSLAYDAMLYRIVKATFQTKDLGEVSETLLVPNFRIPYYMGLGAANETASLMALAKIKALRAQAILEPVEF